MFVFSVLDPFITPWSDHWGLISLVFQPHWINPLDVLSQSCYMCIFVFPFIWKLNGVFFTNWRLTRVRVSNLFSNTQTEVAKWNQTMWHCQNVILSFFFFFYVDSSFSTLIVGLKMIYIVTHTKKWNRRIMRVSNIKISTRSRGHLDHSYLRCTLHVIKKYRLSVSHLHWLVP